MKKINSKNLFIVFVWLLLVFFILLLWFPWYQSSRIIFESIGVFFLPGFFFTFIFFPESRSLQNYNDPEQGKGRTLDLIERIILSVFFSIILVTWILILARRFGMVLTIHTVMSIIIFLTAVNGIGAWLITQREQRMLKRVFDFLLSLLGLIVLSPFLLIIALLIKIDSSGSVFFRQKRVGEKGKIFTIYKFRTMINASHKPDLSVDEIRRLERSGNQDPRVTRVGQFLRKFHIDEFPQLINILSGEMSFVGPRPFFLPRIEANKILSEERIRAKPGLTSLAIVHGGAHLSDDIILQYDIEYIKRQNFLFDLKILLKTISLVFYRRV